MGKQEVKAQSTINDLMVQVMKMKGISKTEIADRLQCSKSHVTQVTTTAQNHWISTVEEVFSAMNETIEFLDKDFKVFNVPGTISTIGQLRKHLGKFYIQFKSNGFIFEIVEKQTWNE